MKIAVLGSGNGGCAVAFDWAQKGHEVYLFDFQEYSTNIEAINRKSGITSTGMLNGFVELKYAGCDIEKVIKGAELIFVVGPAYSTEAFANAAKPYLEKGQIIVVCPSSCGGSIVFKNTIGVELDNDDYIIAETSTLPYAVRVIEPGNINVFLKLKGGLFIAAIPSKNTDKVYSLLKDVYPALIPAKNVLQTTLQNANPIIHPAVSLLNVALIERTMGNFCFYEEGVTEGVGRLIEEADKERIEIGKRLGFDIIKDPVLGMEQGYMQEATYDKGYSRAAEFVISVTRSWMTPTLLLVFTFLIAAFISFFTGTSWGTYAIITPIVIPLAFQLTGGNITSLIYASIAAILGGGCFGDHCSPLSDTTILSSLAAGSDHIDHVNTQIPYALTVAGVSSILYIIVGIIA